MYFKFFGSPLFYIKMLTIDNTDVQLFAVNSEFLENIKHKPRFVFILFSNFLTTRIILVNSEPEVHS